MMRLLRFLEAQSSTAVISLSFILILAIALGDLITGSELSFSIFYLIPISIVAWCTGSNRGLLLAGLGAVLWFVVDKASGHLYSSPIIAYWNALVRLGFFVTVAVALDTIRQAQLRQEELSHFIVHDLRSPLANVMIGLETLQEINAEIDDPMQMELITTCRLSGQRMLTLINALLDLARLERGQMPLQLEPVPAHSLVETAFAEVAAWAGQKGLVLRPQFSPEALQVQADAEVIVRVLINLLSNAIKFSQPTATIIVRVSPFEKGQVAFSVVDEGAGIPKEWAARVFDKFVQVDARKTGQPLGSGLGLAFCQQAVEAHRGRIWVEGGITRGTTITFTLPA